MASFPTFRTVSLVFCLLSLVHGGKKDSGGHVSQKQFSIVDSFQRRFDGRSVLLKFKWPVHVTKIEFSPGQNPDYSLQQPQTAWDSLTLDETRFKLVRWKSLDLPTFTWHVRIVFDTAAGLSGVDTSAIRVFGESEKRATKRRLKCCPRGAFQIDDFEQENQCRTDLFHPTIADELGVWQQSQNNLTRSLLGHMAKRQFPKSTMFLHFMFSDGQVYFKPHAQDGHGYLAREFALMFNDVLRNVSIPDAELFVFTNDLPNILKHEPLPFFHKMGSPTHSDIVMPHPWLYQDGVYVETGATENPTLGKEFGPWRSRDKRLLWRGSPNGPSPDRKSTVHDYRFYTRHKFAELGQRLPHKFDIGFGTWDVVHTNVQDLRERLAPFLADFRNEPEWQANQYIAVVDGVGLSARLADIMYGSSVAFKQRSPFYEFYYAPDTPWIRPGKHYVEFAYSLADLESQYDWAVAHEDLMERMAVESHEFTRDVLYNKIQTQCFVGRMLHDYAHLFSPKDHTRRVPRGFQLVPDVDWALDPSCECGGQKSGGGHDEL